MPFSHAQSSEVTVIGASDIDHHVVVGQIGQNSRVFTPPRIKSPHRVGGIEPDDLNKPHAPDPTSDRLALDVAAVTHPGDAQRSLSARRSDVNRQFSMAIDRHLSAALDTHPVLP